MDRQVVIDAERKIRNAARRCARAGQADKAAAYRYAAHIIRQAIEGNS